MNRIAQGLTLVLLGAAALTSTVPTDLYLNWVKAGFGPFLIATGVIMVLLGALVIAAEVRGESEALDEEPAVAERAIQGEALVIGVPENGSGRSELERAAEEYGGGGSGHDHGHDHSRAPGVAWLLLLPVVAVFVVAPPALGSYTVESTGGSSGPPPRDERGASRFSDNLSDAAPGDVVELDIQQFVLRAWVDEDREMSGREIELTGFAVPNQDGEGWYLARLQMACCAADAVVNKILITDHPAPEADTWWKVRGTWVEPDGDLYEVAQHEMETISVTEVTNPPDPYE